MKAKTSCLILAAVIASFTTSSALAAPKKTAVQAPPAASNTPAPLPKAVPAVPTKTEQAPATPGFVAVTNEYFHTTKTNKVQRFADDMTLKPSQQALTLKLRVSNEGSRGQRFSWFRLSVNGQPLLTEKSLKGATSGIVDVTGLIPAGANQVVIDGAGTPGASISWQLVTDPMVISSIQPKSTTPGGTVVLKGANFPRDINRINAIAGGQVADVISVTPTQLTIKLSEDLKPCKASVVVQCEGLGTAFSSDSLTVSGRPAPQVSSTGTWASPSGATITISGKYFSPNESENQVLFNGIPGQVTEAAAEFLKVVVPKISGAQQTNATVSVVTGGQKSANTVSMVVGGEAVDKNYAPSVRFPQATTQNSSQASTISTSGAQVAPHSEAELRATTESRYNASSQSNGFVIYNP